LGVSHHVNSFLKILVSGIYSFWLLFPGNTKTPGNSSLPTYPQTGWNSVISGNRFIFWDQKVYPGFIFWEVKVYSWFIFLKDLGCQLCTAWLMTALENVFTLNEFNTSQPKQHWRVLHHVDSFFKILVSGIHFGLLFPGNTKTPRNSSLKA